ncbi:MAG: excinuclease ABC subunit UvrA [Kiritimatiellae bacterium]|nr:excinuclease ABC subunit UvrA [Kiritimatiellia bacterium]
MSARKPAAAEGRAFVEVEGARHHNLRDLSAKIPLRSFSVVTGVSGSGKSTLAFDILFASGQARYLECLNAYARQFVQPQARPDVRAIRNLPPTVAIEQRLSQGGWKSTVATATELHNDLRLLFLALGEQRCPDCGLAVQKQTPEQIVARILEKEDGREVSLLARLVSGRKGIYPALAEWAARHGHSMLRVDGVWVPTKPWKNPDRFKEHDIDLEVGRLRASAAAAHRLLDLVRAALRLGGGVLRASPKRGAEYVLSAARACPGCGRSSEAPDPRLFSFNSARGRCPACGGFGVGTARVRDRDAEAERGRRETTFADMAAEETPADVATLCPVCRGMRLNPEALAFRFHGRSIGDYARLSVDALADWADGEPFTPRERAIAAGPLADLRSRLSFLRKTGLGYLALDRAVPTLSGGEAQRIRLAAQLGSNLAGACYVLDEPTIGLHPCDTEKLLDTLVALRDKGNTVVVVEHDEQTMRRADWICDLGPGAGVQGGRLLAQGPLPEILACKESKTARALLHPMAHPTREGGRRALRGVPAVRVRGAFLHNLRNVDAAFPLGRFTVVTGVSGSGKSTLVRDVLFASLAPLTGGGKPAPVGCKAVEGWERIARVLEVDQTPIGRTPRSCPATYVGFWSAIRDLFAATPEARIRGWGADRFSFNVKGGRCPTCEGQGVVRAQMAFLPDVLSECDACRGARFNPETLLARWNGRTVADVLAMSVDEALDFFRDVPQLGPPLALLRDVGLGYLALGQRSNTLSGGEAQRIKLVTELARCAPRAGARTPPTLYVLDEPTVGLHPSDVANLLRVVHRLVDAGHTVVMIEHDPDAMLDADCIVDLGPGGGVSGGRVVARGAPDDLAARPPALSRTAAFLAGRLSGSAPSGRGGKLRGRGRV